MKMSVKFICLAVTFFALMLVTATSAQKTTIRVSTWAGAEEAAELQTILDDINANNTEFEIVHEPIPADYYTTMQTQLAGGAGADLYWVDQDNMSLAAEGVFLPIDDCLADAPAGSAGDVNDYYPGILQIANIDGSVYGLPWIAAPVVTFYNKDLFDAAGLEYPTSDWTWDDFKTTAEALTQDTDGDGNADQWGFIANGWPPPQMFVWQAGGDLLSDDLSSSPIDDPAVIEGLEFYKSLIYNPAISPNRETIAEQGFGELFKAGKIGMFMGGAADDLDRVPDLNVGVVSVPHHPTTGDNTTFAWSAATVISANTQNPELACQALIQLSEGIQDWKIVSPRVSQANKEHLIESEARKEASADAILEASQNMRAFHIFGNFKEWNSVLWDEFLNPFLNDETDLSVAELAGEVRPDLEDTLP
jgi:multiple sugar transport system substrate-binding protein